MSQVDAYIGEIALFPYMYVPPYWLECNGQALPRQQFGGLYAVIGNTYGGDPGSNMFNLPNLNARAAMGAGQGPGLSMRNLGQNCGEEAVQLTSLQTGHTHALINKGAANPGVDKTSAPQATSTLGGITIVPAGGGPLIGANSLITNGTPNVDMNGQSIGAAGMHNPIPHDNYQPFLVMRYCISTAGDFPQPD